MPGNEQKIMNRAENRARSAIISSLPPPSVYRQLYLTNYVAERGK